MSLTNGYKFFMAYRIFDAKPRYGTIKEKGHYCVLVNGLFHFVRALYLYNLCTGSGNGLIEKVAMAFFRASPVAS